MMTVWITWKDALRMTKKPEKYGKSVLNNNLMRQIVYKCDQCEMEIGNNPHISLYIGHTSGIAMPPTEDNKRWVVKDQIANKAIHFCSSEHIKTYFHEKMKNVTAYKNLRSDSAVTMEEACEILGKENVHGMNDLKKVFPDLLEWLYNPVIPFSREDLLKAKEQNEILILCLDGIDGKPLTMRHLNELVQKEYDKKDLGKFIYDTEWYEKEDFYCKETMQFGWKLISRECIPDSKNKTFSEQDDLIKKYPEYKRATALEVTYLIAVHILSDEKHERLFEKEYFWTSYATPDGDLVFVGYANRGGVLVYGFYRGYSSVNLGVCLSR